MRMPRVRFTIGRLMVAVLVAGLATWVGSATWHRGSPTIPERQAEAAYKQAMLVREVAELAIREYQEGIYQLDRATYEGQVALAHSDQERAVDRLKWSTDMRNKGFVPAATNIADQLTKQRADFELEQARTQLDVLEKYTKQKQLKSLQNDLEKARAYELSKRQTYRLERAKRSRFFGF